MGVDNLLLAFNEGLGIDKLEARRQLVQLSALFLYLVRFESVTYELETRPTLDQRLSDGFDNILFGRWQLLVSTLLLAISKYFTDTFG
jgi:hypothetical protein